MSLCSADSCGSWPSIVLKRKKMNYKEYSCAAVTDNLDEVMSFIETGLDECGCSFKTKMQIDVAVDEIFANVASYAYEGGAGEVTVRFEMIESPSGVKITFIDSGMAFDPLAKEDPELGGTAEERKIGGLGIFMVKKTMDDVSYERRDGRNIFSMTKYFDKPEADHGRE